MKTIPLLLLAASFAVRPLPREEGPLELSVQNEVDHAAALGIRWLARQHATNAVSVPVRADWFGTNGLTRAKIALKLVSSQRSGGYWSVTNTVFSVRTNMRGGAVITNRVPDTAATAAALEILKGL